MAAMASALIPVSAFAASRSGTSTPTIRLRFGASQGSVTTNGPYTLVMSGGGAGQVLDEITGQRVRLQLPAYCPSPAAQPVLGNSWLMEACDASHLALYSLADRSWREVTVASGCVHFNAGPGSACVPLAIGTEWINWLAPKPHVYSSHGPPTVPGALQPWNESGVRCPVRPLINTPASLANGVPPTNTYWPSPDSSLPATRVNLALSTNFPYVAPSCRVPAAPGAANATQPAALDRREQRPDAMGASGKHDESAHFNRTCRHRSSQRP